MKRLLIILLTISAWGTPTTSQATPQLPGEVALSAEDAVLFGPEAALDLEIVLDMKAMFRKKKDEEYDRASFSILTESGERLTRDIGVKARGQYRRSFCAIPPLKLKFKGAEFGYEDWDALKSIKLVTTCKNSESFNQYLIKEYLAYKLYNALTPRSLRVRMANITFIDSKGKFDPVVQMGFFIEDIDDLAERNDAFELEPEVMSESWADPAATALMTVFEYAIGNTDWHVGNLHNMKVIKSNDPVAGSSYLVPYDFDFSGFVNTHYALPNETLMIPDVKTRLYLGRCGSESDIRAALETVYQVRGEWEEILNSCIWINDDIREDSQEYLDEFFSILEDPRRTELVFFQDCSNLASD